MIPEEGLKAALALVDRLEVVAKHSGRETERVLQSILIECGFWLSASQFSDPDQGPVDMAFNGQLEGRQEKVGVILKAVRGPVSGQTVYQALDVARAGFDRVLLISTGGFTRLALDRGKMDRLGRVDLLTPEDLRCWLRRHAAPPQEVRTCSLIIREAMRSVARRLGDHPGELDEITWVDLERVLREVFEGLGFTTELTRPAMDGGFDLRLTDEQGQVVLVEVKHWAEPNRVGPKQVSRLIEVTAREGAAGGLLLSRSGYTDTVYNGLIVIPPKVRLGDGDKIRSLCRIYSRLGSELWQPEGGLLEGLYEGTH